MTGPALLCAGVSIDTGERIGRGGEGAVYATAGDPARAIKLYLKPDTEHEIKVRAMIAAQLANKCTSVAFPLELVSTPNGRFAGFTMRRVSNSEPIFELFASGSRRERFPNADWALLVRTATNVARVVAQVHAAGAVIGDINSAGFLVSQQAMVTLIDADSFQITGYRCRVGMAEYTPPELQGLRFDAVDRTIDHDAFGLAVMIFQLLALGRHPQAGVRGGRSIPLETAITQGRFAYSLIRKVGSTPPPHSLTLRDLPLGIRTLFERAFALRMGSRPTAREWVEELTLLEAGLARCIRNPAHAIATLSSPCPWCRIEKELGRPLFPAPPSIGSTPHSAHTDLHHEVDRVVRFARDQAGETIQPMWRRAEVVPSRAALGQLGADGQSPTAMVGSGIQFAFTHQASTRAFVDRYMSTQAGAAKALDRWRTDLGIWEINTRAETLRQDLFDLDRLKAGRPVLLAQATERVVAAAAVQMMRNLPLDATSVPGIGARLRAHLVRHGIATAADVTRERLNAVPGLGDTRSAGLLLWRDRIMVEVQRSVGHDQRQFETGIAAEVASLGDQIGRAEDSLRVQCADIEQRVAEVRKRIWLTDRRLEDALHDRDQAMMDLELLGLDHNSCLALSRVPIPSPVRVSAPTKPKKTSGKAKRHPIVCPACGAPMVKRWANSSSIGNTLFFGCSTYPRCLGTRPITRKRAGP